VRSDLGVKDLAGELAYFLSVYENRSIFFKLYNRMLCLRMIDNFQKFYEADKEIVSSIQNTIISGEIIDIKKVL
jgi:hypothetical protein